MRIIAISVITVTIMPLSANASDYSDMADFAQSICGDIPSGTLSKTTIKGAVEANAGLLARIVNGNANLTAEQVKQLYIGIPLDKLPDNIPTVSMCKSELVKVLLARKKIVANICRKPEFGQVGWGRSEVYSNSSGRVGGGGDQNQWCNQVASSFISSRSIGPENKVERVSSSEESNKDWKGHVTYKYHCTIKVSWDPVYAARQDASACGTHEE
jgi:hypothetical protein